MKKIIFILLAFFYSSISSGAVIALHYCIQEVESCSGCSMDHATSNSTQSNRKIVKKADCCKVKTKLIKTDVAKSAELLQQQIASSFALPSEPVYLWQGSLLFPRKAENYRNNILLQYQQVPIFIRNCNFRL